MKSSDQMIRVLKRTFVVLVHTMFYFLTTVSVTNDAPVNKVGPRRTRGLPDRVAFQSYFIEIPFLLFVISVYPHSASGRKYSNEGKSFIKTIPTSHIGCGNALAAEVHFTDTYKSIMI